MHGCRCSGPRSASPRCAPGRQVPVRRFGAGSVAIPAAIGVAFLSAIAASAARALIAYSCVARSPKDADSPPAQSFAQVTDRRRFRMLRVGHAA